jgi:hypothetical protein
VGNARDDEHVTSVPRGPDLQASTVSSALLGRAGLCCGVAGVRRRTRFTTPFVLVLGCGHAPERPRPVPADAAIVTIAPDVAVAAVVDAGVPDARTERVEVEPCVSTERYRCNPPLPVDPPTEYFGEATIENGRSKPGALIFNIRRMPDDITRKWRGVFVDPNRKDIAGTDFPITDSGGGRAWGTLATTSTSLPSGEVRVYKPIVKGGN